MAQVAKRDVCIPQDGRVVEAVCMECTNFGEEYMKTFSRSYKTFSANSKTSSANCETFSAGWRQQRRTRPSTAVSQRTLSSTIERYPHMTHLHRG